MIHFRKHLVWILLTGMLVFSSYVISMTTLAQSQELLVLVHDAEYKPPTETDFRWARSEATTALASVESHLKRHDASGQWREYLLLDDLAVALADFSIASPLSHLGDGLEDDSVPDRVSDVDTTAELRATLGRTIGKHPGLETPAILKLRQCLQHLVDVHAQLTSTGSAEAFTAKRRSLLELLGLPEVYRDRDWYRKAGRLVSWFDEFQQAGEVVRRAKRHWSQPNLEAQISAPALGIITRREVSETEPIREYKDERWILGQALATGVARMVPQATATAECRIVFDGNIRSNMGGSQGPVSFQLAGITQLHVEQPILFSQDAFTLLSPLPTASTRLWTDRVSTKRNGLGSRLIRKIATKMIAKEQPQARRDLNENSRDKFVKKFTEDVAEEIGEAFSDLQNDLFAPMNRLDIRPDDFHFVSSGTSLQARMTLNGGFGLGATSVAPEFPTIVDSITGNRTQSDLAVSVHESVVNRLAQRMLAGETLRDPAKLAQKSGLEMTDEQLEKIPSDVAVVLADEQPVSIRFENDVIELTFIGERLEVGSAVLVGMKATVRYRIGVRGGDLVLNLEGSPQVLPIEGGGSGRFYLQKNVLEKRLAKELPKETSVDGFDLPEPANRLGRAAFRSATAREGWLQIELMGER